MQNAPQRTLLCLLIGLAASCGGDYESGAYDFGGMDAGDGQGRDDASNGSGGGFDEEDSVRLTAPESSRNFVFIANTAAGTLAKVAVSGDSIVITTVRVGAEPTEVATSPSNDVAVVLNEGSSSVSIVRAAPVGLPDEVVTLPIPAGCNRLELAPDAETAFAWYDNARAEAGDRPGALSEVAAIGLAEGQEDVAQLSVGVNVRGIQYSADGQTAFIITDDGVSRIALADADRDQFIAPVGVGRGESAVGTEREIRITPDGLRALVREADVPALGIVTLATGSRQELEFESVPTDIDLIGTGATALISLPDEGATALIDLELLASEPLLAMRRSSVDGLLPRSATISGDGQTALLWDADAGEDTPRVGLLDIATADVEVLNVRKGVLGATFSPLSDRALLVHTRAPGDPVAGAPEAEILARSSAFSVIARDGSLSKLVLTRAQPGEVAFSEDGRSVFVLVADAARGAQSLWWVDLQTLQTTELPFARLPEHVGVVPGRNMVWVSQVHTLGRIAFIDIDSGEVREVTGFELNSFIE